ncbi:MAG: M20 family metallopeptidase [Eubacteriales bacterium]|nr:M20 family metallopeptidase [Eubacteriales bacterium]
MCNLSENILFELRKKEEEYCKIRRHFHKIPELGLKEYKTTDGICEILESLGIHPIPLEPTGLVAYIGPENAPTIALRADIDALAVTEETGLPYASEHVGYMHACGHDGHLTGLIGAAEYLKKMEEDLTCRVKLIFQPSEENTLGAKTVIAQGVMEDVDAIFGIHLFSDIPYGTISVEPGPRMAQTDRFTITFEGKGGHAGKPHLCVDSTVLAAEFVLAAQTIVSRQVNPVDAAVVTIGSLHSGTQYNIISPKAVLEGTCRSFHIETARLLKESIERKASAIAMSYGAEFSIDYDFGSHPP